MIQYYHKLTLVTKYHLNLIQGGFSNVFKYVPGFEVAYCQNTLSVNLMRKCNSH